MTVVLSKPEKDHFIPKGYRPIALLNTIGKAMEFILAKRIVYLAKTYHLLSVTHMRDRRLRSCEYGIYYLLKRIYQVWNSDKVATLLLLDVLKVYDKISYPRLLHNLRKRSIDPNIIKWVESFLFNRITVLKTSEHIISRTPIATGIPQGSSLSPILYLFYNSDLIDACNTRIDLNIIAIGFVDDIGLLTVGDTTEDNCNSLRKIHEEVCLSWVNRYGSEFDPKKYQLVHHSRKQRAGLGPALQLNATQSIEAREFVTYLGVQMDRRLQWNDRIREIRAKAIISIGVLARIAGFIWGGNYRSIRQLYQVIVISQITYCCSTWYQPKGSFGHNKSHLLTLQRIQSTAVRKITDAFRVISAPALDVETYLLSIKQQLKKLTSEVVLRIATSPSHNNIIKLRTERWKSKRRPRKNRKTSSLKRHIKRFEIRYGSIQQIEKLQLFSTSSD